MLLRRHGPRDDERGKAARGIHRSPFDRVPDAAQNAHDADLKAYDRKSGMAI